MRPGPTSVTAWKRLGAIERPRIAHRREQTKTATRPDDGDHAAHVEQQESLPANLGKRMVEHGHGAERQENPQLGRPDRRERQPEDADRVRREKRFGRHEEVGSEQRRARSSAVIKPEAAMPP